MKHVFRVTGRVGHHEFYTAISGLLYDLYYLAPDEALPAERAAIFDAIRGLEAGPWRLVDPRIFYDGPIEHTSSVLAQLISRLASRHRREEGRRALIFAMSLVIGLR